MTTGTRIHPVPPRPTADLVEAFRPFPTPVIGDCLDRLRGATGLRPFHGTGKLLGVALTVKTRPGDNLFVHKAIDLALPGDVLVVDGGGDVTHAIVGDLLGLHARLRGLAGFVIDGAIRDVAGFRDFPCFARAVALRGPYKDGPGEIGAPVAVGGLVVSPGDIVIGDEDGVVAIRPGEAPGVLEAARRKAADEEEQRLAILEGRWDRAWVDATLKAKGWLPR